MSPAFHPVTGELSKRRGVIGGLELVMDMDDHSTLTVGATSGGVEQLDDVYGSLEKFEDVGKVDNTIFVQYEYGW